MDRLESMRVLSRVVESGGSARAAQQLDMSNAVVTRYLADLERHLGTRLLNRTTRSLSLTEAGETYLHRCRQILEDVTEAEASVMSQGRSLSGL
jgi:DNA-binding transcriptional LysR family regulator